MRFFASFSIVLFSIANATAEPLPCWRQVVPAAASVRGNHGADWHTDVVIHNPSSETVVVSLALVGPSPDGLPGMPDTRVLPEDLGPGQTLVLTQAVASLFPEHSLGALIVTAHDAEGQSVPVIVTSRTWTSVSGHSGTYGQGIPAVAWEDGGTMNGLVRVLVGLDASEAFRTNIGLVNLSSNVLGVFAIDIPDSAGETLATHWLELPPQTWIQNNGLLAFLGLEGSDMTAVVRLVDWLGLNPGDPVPVTAPDWVAYGSRVDNRTNDPTFVEALPETTRWGITRQRIVPVAAHTAGEEGSLWVTDLLAHHGGDTVPTFLQVDVVPAAGTPVGSPSSFTIPIWPGQTLSIDDVIGEHFPSHQVAALVVKGWNGGALYTDLKVSSRIWTASADGEGTYGQSISGLPRRYGSDQVIIPGLTGSALFRSNLGIANPSTNLRETFTIEVFDAEGQSQGALSSTLEPMSQTLVSWIDTWVGPGHSSGEGWRITYDFVFYPGTPRTPIEVRNVWGRRTVAIGDPDNPIDDQVDPVALEIPADVTRVEARLITTGHYFGVTENCAEFCVLRQNIYVDDQLLSVLPWRTDCEYNPHSPQAGTWTYDRNGWCPGAVVVGNTVDLTDMVTPGETTFIDFDIRRQDGSVYENTAGGSPFEWVSMQVFLYR